LNLYLDIYLDNFNGDFVMNRYNIKKIAENIMGTVDKRMISFLKDSKNYIVIDTPMRYFMKLIKQHNKKFKLKYNDVEAKKFREKALETGKLITRSMGNKNVYCIHENENLFLNWIYGIGFNEKYEVIHMNKIWDSELYINKANGRKIYISRIYDKDDIFISILPND